MKPEERKPMTAEQTHDPNDTRIIVDILKEISPEYADCSYNLIDCLERLVGRVLATMVLGGTAKESTNAAMYLLAESIEKIHDAIVRDYDNEIEKL